MLQKFEYSIEGYMQAKKWLKSIGKWEEVSTRGFSTDGWSIVAAANSIFNNLPAETLAAGTLASPQRNDEPLKHGDNHE